MDGGRLTFSRNNALPDSDEFSSEGDALIRLMVQKNPHLNRGPSNPGSPMSGKWKFFSNIYIFVFVKKSL
jgi:hypothetical protein